jgi:hypothetical protein
VPHEFFTQDKRAATRHEQEQRSRNLRLQRHGGRTPRQIAGRGVEPEVTESERHGTGIGGR